MRIIISCLLKGKRLLILGFILASISTIVGILNNFGWFHKRFDNWLIWRNFNRGANSILQIGDNPQIKDVEGIQNIVVGDGPTPHFANPRVSYLMDTDSGFEEMKHLIINNLLNKPTYKVNAIINEQVWHRGKHPDNPYLSQRIISLIPIPEMGRRYKTITAEDYRKREEVTTESFLVEWIKNYKKTFLFHLCLCLFASGIFLQMIYHLRTR